MERRMLLTNRISDTPPNNEIWYTSSDGNIVKPDNSSAFGATIISNTYSDGKGIIKFETDVTSIGNSAFWYCESFTSIVIPNTVKNIGNYAFVNCNALTSVNIPDSVTSIGEQAFHDCSSLTSVTIPNSVTNIGDDAFENCSSLISIIIPNTITSIGKDTFKNCSSLTSITIPDSVTSIGNQSFRNCSSLTSITIPDSVTSIGYYAFRNCSAIISATIGNSITSIDDMAFAECTALKSITFKGTTEQWYNIDIDSTWRDGSAITIIHCTDGDIDLNATYSVYYVKANNKINMARLFKTLFGYSLEDAKTNVENIGRILENVNTNHKEAFDISRQINEYGESYVVKL